MTNKEVEHFMIENGFDYEIQGEGGPFAIAVWTHRKIHFTISDSFVQEVPKEAFERIQKVLSASTRN